MQANPAAIVHGTLLMIESARRVHDGRIAERTTALQQAVAAHAIQPYTVTGPALLSSLTTTYIRELEQQHSELTITFQDKRRFTEVDMAQRLSAVKAEIKVINERLNTWKARSKTLQACYVEQEARLSAELKCTACTTHAAAVVTATNIVAQCNTAKAKVETHISQVHVIYLAELLDQDFAAGEETLELRLFREDEIPWDEIAFRTIHLTLKHYFADRREGRFQFRALELKPYE